MDKGYDNPTGEAACAKGGYVPHIRRIGEEKKEGLGREDPPLHAAGRRAHNRLATTMPRTTHPLRQEANQLQGPHPTRLRTDLVPPTPPTSTRLKSFRTVLSSRNCVV
jgi:hypothetical protein